MRRTGRRGSQRRAGHQRHPLSKAQLDALVADATTDAYGEGEQAVGLLTLLEDNLQLPFEAELLGVKVTVERVDITENLIVAVCRRGSKRLKVPILDLPLPIPPPAGVEWIAAYRYWRTRHL